MLLLDVQIEAQRKKHFLASFTEQKQAISTKQVFFGHKQKGWIQNKEDVFNSYQINLIIYRQIQSWNVSRNTGTADVILDAQ